MSNNPLSHGPGGEEQRQLGHDRLAEGVAIVAISSVLFDMWTAGWLAGDLVADHVGRRLSRHVTYFLLFAVLFGIYWAYRGWADTHNLKGNPFVDSYDYFTGRSVN